MADANAPTKVDVLRALKDAFGYRSYLENTTTMTGGRYREAHDIGWARCNRIVYRHVGAMYDDLSVDFSAPDEDISQCLDSICAQKLQFDVALVDAHHTYHCADRDLRELYRLVRRGGAVVMHDCWPRDDQIISPTFTPGNWCGVSYKAYLDFVLGNPFLDYFTLDADYGCGVILKSTSLPRHAENIGRAILQAPLAQRWHAIGSNYGDAYDFLGAHSKSLLRLGDWPSRERRLAAGL